MEMDPKLFDECSATNHAKQEELQGTLDRKEQNWKAIESMAELNPIYPKVKHALKPKASLAYAMRLNEAKDALVDDSADISANAAGGFAQQPGGHGFTDADSHRRKSMLPQNA